MTNSVAKPVSTTPPPSVAVRAAGFAGFTFALLQSLCTAVFAISGIRVAIGLTAIAGATGVFAPLGVFHQDAIRIPMLAIGALLAVVNLAVLFRVWSLRRRASGSWRRRTLSVKERRSERLQLCLALLALVLVGLELWTHAVMHRTPPAPVQVSSH